jgi:hypothetical protein
MSDSKGKQRQPLSVQLGALGAVMGAVLGAMLVGPLVFSVPPNEMFNVKSMLSDAICGVVGYFLGFLIGRMIEGRRA